MTVPSSMGFVERIQAEATAETSAVVTELLALVPHELRDRASKVARVLDALDMPVAPELAFFLEDREWKPRAETAAPLPPPRPAPVPEPSDVKRPEPSPTPRRAMTSEGATKERAMEEARAEGERARAEQAARSAEADARRAAAERAATEAEHDRAFKKQILERLTGRDWGEDERIKAPDVARRLGIEPPRAKKLLEELAHHEHIKKFGSGPDATYGIEAEEGPATPEPDTKAAAAPAPTPASVSVSDRYQPHRGRIGGRDPRAAAAAKAKTQRAILNYIGDHPGTTLASIVNELQIAQGTTSKHLRDLGEDGKVVRTGKPGTKDSGYKLADGVEPPDGPLRPGGDGDKGDDQVAPAAATPAPDAKVVPSRQETLNIVRAAMNKFRDRDFLAGDVHEQVKAAHPNLDIPLSMTDRILSLLADQGALERKGDGYHYERPDDPGPAARMDAQRRATGRGPRVVSEAVPGTGRPSRAANSEVNALLRSVKAIVGEENVVHTSGGHFQIKCPNGESVLISSTPSNPRSIATDRARLRRIGGLAI